MNIVKCPKCERELSENVKYCIHCGILLFRECPGCKKQIPFIKDVCEFCNIDIVQYEEGKKLLKEGRKFEDNWKYEEAKAEYEKIKGPPVILEEALKLLSDVVAKIEIINDQRFKDEKFFETHLLQAKKTFLKTQELLPNDKNIADKLNLIETRLKWRFKKIWIGTGVLVVFGLSGFFFWYVNTLSCLTERKLELLLGSKNLDVKNSSALTLGWRGNKTSVPILKILANSGDERKSVYSLSALLGMGEAYAMEGMNEIAWGGRSIASRIGAAWCLVNLGDTTIIPELVAYLNGNNESLKIASAVLLFNLGYSVGISVIEQMLKSEVYENRIKGLYALYLLGNKQMLTWYEENWIPSVKDLLWDSNLDVRAIVAFLLNEFSTDLTSQDSVAITQILWEEFINNESHAMLKIDEMPEISEFCIAKGIINKNGDENIVDFKYSANIIRKKCWRALSKIELEDKVTIKEVKEALNSTEKYERLYVSLVLLEYNKKEAIPVLKKLIKDKDEVFKLNTCKLIFEFI